MPKANGTLRQRLRAVAAEAMLDSAERAMIKHGFERATMQQIAAEAGCAAGTFYLYFQNKHELLQAIVARHATAMYGGGQRALQQPGRPLDRIHAGIASIVTYIFQHKPFFRLLFTAMPLRHRMMHQSLHEKTRQEQEDYGLAELELLRQAQRQKAIRTDIPAELLQDYMFGGGFGIIERFIFSGEKVSAEDAVRTLWGLITSGIGVSRSAIHAS
jgi:AcrR family transcriptional regulator